jgi:putative intracellular protease/amidase
MLSLFALLLVLAVAALVGTAAPEGTKYVCPPCGASCDDKVFTAPGVCPTCGMTLVEAGSAAAKAAAQAAADPDRKKIAILVFNGVEVLDFAGPYEMFGAANGDVYTVAATKDPVTSAMGLTVVPRYSFADAPRPDVLVVPGGGVYGASRDEATLKYIRDVTAVASNTMSVCNGAFILANAGLLDGLTATTTYHNIPKLASQYPKIKVVGDQRYVDNGKIITTGGLSAGIDGALHVIARLYGTGYAQSVALGEEYDWKPEGGFARAAMADHQIPEVTMDDLGKWDLVRTEGDASHWDIVMNGHSSLTATDLMARIEQALAKGQWRKDGTAEASATSRASTWRFTGKDGKPWSGTLRLRDKPGANHEYEAEVTVARAG